MNYEESTSIDQIIPALASFHIEFQEAGLKKDRQNDHLKNKYVTLDNILHTIRPILAKNGLVIVQALAGEYLVTSLYHISGQYIKTQMPFLPMAGNRGTNPLQDLGGGITYARRYALSALLSLSVDIDDDAESAGKLSQKPKQELRQKQEIKVPEKKSKKAVTTEEELNKLVDWLNANPSRQGDVENFYELNEDQKKFIKDNLTL
jgi:hypothetical protein